MGISTLRRFKREGVTKLADLENTTPKPEKKAKSKKETKK